jgi:2,5-diketo-D-gluconate reductase A
MKANFELFDFEPDSPDMDAITGLDKGDAGRTGPNPDTFDYMPRYAYLRATAVATYRPTR